MLHEDTTFMFECVLKAKRVKYENINFYRQKEGSIVNSKTRRNLIHTLFEINQIVELYNKNRLKNRVINTYILNLYHSIIKKLK